MVQIEFKEKAAPTLPLGDLVYGQLQTDHHDGYEIGRVYRPLKDKRAL
jgi:hypothetical protein